MKVIDLLNQIAKDKVIPNKIKYRQQIYEFQSWCEDYQNDEGYYLFEEMFTDNKSHLNDEVGIGIIEDNNKIEKLKITKIVPQQNYIISDSKNHSVDERLEIIRKRLYAHELYILDIANKINEIIDKLEELDNE